MVNATVIIFFVGHYCSSKQWWRCVSVLRDIEGPANAPRAGAVVDCSVGNSLDLMTLVNILAAVQGPVLSIHSSAARC